jgi:hypothetical protein
VWGQQKPYENFSLPNGNPVPARKRAQCTSPSLREGGFAAAHADTAPKLSPGGGGRKRQCHTAQQPPRTCVKFYRAIAVLKKPIHSPRSTARGGDAGRRPSQRDLVKFGLPAAIARGDAVRRFPFENLRTTRCGQPFRES